MAHLHTLSSQTGADSLASDETPEAHLRQGSRRQPAVPAATASTCPRCRLPPPATASLRGHRRLLCQSNAVSSSSKVASDRVHAAADGHSNFIHKASWTESDDNTASNRVRRNQLLTWNDVGRDEVRWPLRVHCQKAHCGTELPSSGCADGAQHGDAPCTARQPCVTEPCRDEQKRRQRWGRRHLACGTGQGSDTIMPCTGRSRSQWFEPLLTGWRLVRRQSCNRQSKQDSSSCRRVACSDDRHVQR